MVFVVSKRGIGVTQCRVCTAVTFTLKLIPHLAPVQARTSPAPGALHLIVNWFTKWKPRMKYSNLHITQNAPDDTPWGKTHLVSAFESLLSISRKPKSEVLPARKSERQQEFLPPPLCHSADAGGCVWWWILIRAFVWSSSEPSTKEWPVVVTKRCVYTSASNGLHPPSILNKLKEINWVVATHSSQQGKVPTGGPEGE